MKKTRKTLLLEFWTPIAVSLLLVVLYENDILLTGDLSDETTTEYYSAIAMELITICLIPFALRLFKFKKIHASVVGNGAKGLLRWASVRMAMLTVPMMINTWLYYQFMNVAFGYMGIIGLLCLVFVYPSLSRCNAEISK